MNNNYKLSSAEEKDGEGKPLIRYDISLTNNENIAYAVVRPVSSEGDGPWISGLCVRSDHRGKGLASELMRRIESDFEGQVLRGRARPYKDEPMETEELLEMYGAWGFEPYDPDEPTRLKKQV